MIFSRRKLPTSGDFISGDCLFCNIHTQHQTHRPLHHNKSLKLWLMCSGRFGDPYKRLELYAGGSRIMWNLPVMGIAVFSWIAWHWYKLGTNWWLKSETSKSKTKVITLEGLTFFQKHSTGMNGASTWILPCAELPGFLYKWQTSIV